MKLEKVIPFGRSLDEYKRMFALSEVDLSRKIIGVADGPASFNADMFAFGRRVVSVDPLYEIPAGEIERQFYTVVDDIIGQVKAAPDDWVWWYHRSPEHLRENRIAVLHRFLTDYEYGRSDGRYVVGQLPDLDFADHEFDLALCSHFLFLYSEHLSYEFHLASIREMLRVAGEVRIFPLLTLTLDKSPYLQALIDQLNSDGLTARVVKVDYELQRGGNEMLRVGNGSTATKNE